MLPHHTAAHMKIPGLAGELLLPGSSEAQGIISGLQQEPLLSSFTLLLQAQQESISFLINFHLVSLQSSDTCLVSVTPLLPHQQGEFCTIVNRGLPAPSNNNCRLLPHASCVCPTTAFSPSRLSLLGLLISPPSAVQDLVILPFSGSLLPTSLLAVWHAQPPLSKGL